MTGKTNDKEFMLERYELKFVIPYELIDPICDFIKPYCTEDHYSAVSPVGFYGINSLYFDTPTYTFMRNRIVGVEKRFNMRVRTYAGNPDKTYFFEIKNKRGSVVKKIRGVFKGDDWYELLEGSYRFQHQLTQNMSEFVRVADLFGAQPQVLTQYERKAFFSHCDHYARVTFDRNLKYTRETTYNIVPQEEKMTNYDEDKFFMPECNVILELKCNTTSVPLWMVDLIRAFNLERTSFSKYFFAMITFFEKIDFAQPYLVPSACNVYQNEKLIKNLRKKDINYQFAGG